MISLLKDTSNSILPSSARKLIGIWDVDFRGCKYLKMIYSTYMKISKNILKEKYVASQEAECS